MWNKFISFANCQVDYLKADITGSIENYKTDSLSLKAMQSYWKRVTEKQSLKYITEVGEAEARGLRVLGQPQKKLCFGYNKSQMSKTNYATQHAEEGAITGSGCSERTRKLKPEQRTVGEDSVSGIEMAVHNTCSGNTRASTNLLHWLTFQSWVREEVSKAILSWCLQE